MGLSVKEGAKVVIGPKHMVVKLCVLLVIAVLVVISVYKPMYHVTAPFEFAPIEPHAVAAPTDGLILDISNADETGHVNPHGTRKIKAGDFVYEGDVLVTLDATDNKIKLGESLARYNSKIREAEKYRAEDKTAEAAMSMWEGEGARYESEYLQKLIERAVIRAPFSGQILKGDLEDKMRAPVKQGDVLFEIGTPENLRVELSGCRPRYSRNPPGSASERSLCNQRPPRPEI